MKRHRFCYAQKWRCFGQLINSDLNTHQPFYKWHCNNINRYHWTRLRPVTHICQPTVNVNIVVPNREFLASKFTQCQNHVIPIVWRIKLSWMIVVEQKYWSYGPSLWQGFPAHRKFSRRCLTFMTICFTPFHIWHFWSTIILDMSQLSWMSSRFAVANTYRHALLSQTHVQNMSYVHKARSCKNQWCRMPLCKIFSMAECCSALQCSFCNQHICTIQKTWNRNTKHS